MGNKTSSPFPTFDNAKNILSTSDIDKLRTSYKQISSESGVITSANFNQIPCKCSQYVRKFLLPRLFLAIDTKKDGYIDFEEYLCAMTTFKKGAIDDKIKLLFILYDPVKGTFLLRDQLRQLLIDSIVVNQREEMPSLTLEEWILDLRELAEGMVESALYQYANQDGKLDYQEFSLLAKMDTTIQSYILKLPGLLEI